MIRPTSLLVMDDHQSFVDALALHVNERDDVVLVGTATTARDGLDLLSRLACDVVVLAHRLLAGGSAAGADAVAAIRRLWPGPIVLLVDLEQRDHNGAEDLLDVLAAGVCGWVDRSAGLDAVVNAVRGVSRGESHLPTEQVQALLASRTAQRLAITSTEVRGLTEREAAVLRGLAAGLSRAEIGVSLQLSPNTVRTHVRSILRKYHVHSAPAAVALLTVKDSPYD